jgi:HSP20 family protein
MHTRRLSTLGKNRKGDKVMAIVRARRGEPGRSDLARLHNEMDELFGGMLRGWEWPSWDGGRWPALDIAERDNEYEVTAEVPGCKAEDIDISVHGNTMTISGEKKQEHEEKHEGYYHVERSYGTFRRDVNLGGEIDPSKINASCKDGILTVTVPKSEKAKPTKVKIQGQ